MRTLFSCIFMLAFVAVAAHTPASVVAHASASPVPIVADRISAPQPLLPHCAWLPDPEGLETIDSVTSDPVQQRFAPLPGRFPLKGEGPVWLRLVIIKNQSAAPADTSRLSVNLGALPPGNTYLYMSRPPGQLGGENGWHVERVFPHEIVDLPAPGLLPVTIYIRMAETPGLWFAPSISARSAVQPDVLPSALFLPGLLIVAAAALLLRGIAERALWALWAALFLLCALAQTLLPLPAPAWGFRPEHLPALLAPGMALILLPHIGRCIFRSSGLSPARDTALYLLSFIGVAVALGPLLPGLAWLTRLFPLWPLLTLPLLPLCVSALAARQPGALAFSGACAMPLLGALVSLYALYSAPFIHPLAAQGSLWGLAVGGLGLVLARVPSGNSAQAGEAETPVPAGLVLAESAVDAAKAHAADSGLKLGETPAFTHRSQYDDLPSLELVRSGDKQPAPESAPEGEETPFLLTAKHDPSAPISDPDSAQIPSDSAAPLEYAAPATQEAHETPDAPPARQETHETSTSPGPDRVISLVDDELSALSDELREMEEEAARQTSFATESGFLFSLHSLVREVHSVVAPLAKNRGLVFSWYISPLLPPLLEGDAPRLRGALTLLLQNAVLATRKGSVQLAVRKNPGSGDPGNLLFMITDSGSAQRTEAGFFHAWEMAARTGGVFMVEYSPLNGTQISFTVRFSLPTDQAAGELLDAFPDMLPIPAEEGGDDDIMPVLHNVLLPTSPEWVALTEAAPNLFAEESEDSINDETGWPPEQLLDEPNFLVKENPPAEKTPPAAPRSEHRAEAPVPFAPPVPGLCRIIAAEMTTSNRRLLSHYLTDLPHEYVSAATNAQVPEIFRTGAVSLIIFDGDTPEHDIVRALRAVRDIEQKNGLPATSVLVLTSHATQSERLLESGADHALIKPVSKADLCAIVAQMPPAKITEQRQAGQREQAQEVDILAAALRGAPQQQGTPVEVTLPPRHGDLSPLELNPLPPGDAAAAAPMLRGLSTDDVTPVSTQVPSPPAGSLLDFVLPGPAPAGAKPEPAPDPEPELATEAEPQFAVEAAPEPEPEPEPELTPDPEPESVPEPEAAPEAGQEQQPASFYPLPGLDGEALDVLVLPLTPGLIHALKDIRREIQQAAERGQSIMVQEAAGRLAGKAEVFGLVKLGKLAHCVERAAEAGDLEAVRTLLEDLEPVIECYLESLQECFDTFLYSGR